MKLDIEHLKEIVEDMGRASRDFDNAVYDLELLGEWDDDEGSQHFYLVDEDQIKMWNKHVEKAKEKLQELEALLESLGEPLEIPSEKKKPRKKSKTVSK